MNILGFIQQHILGGLVITAGTFAVWKVVSWVNGFLKINEKAVEFASKWAYKKGVAFATFLKSKIKDEAFLKSELRDLAAAGPSIWTQFVAGMRSVVSF